MLLDHISNSKIPKRIGVVDPVDESRDNTIEVEMDGSLDESPRQQLSKAVGKAKKIKHCPPCLTKAELMLVNMTFSYYV